MSLAARTGVMLFAVAVLVLPAAAPAARGVILYWSPDRATFEPHSCVYANSGWQYEGQWYFYPGTPIASQYFITAKHLGGAIGSVFTYNGQSYATTAVYPSSASDLQIWQVSGAFPTYAPLYTRSNEVGQTMTVFGRGTARGGAVTVGGQTKGWTWGASDHVQSWGSNKVSGVFDAGGTVGQLLRFTFDAAGDWYEGSLSGGDSGGGVFIKDGSTWKLAGINYGTDSPYSYTGHDAGFAASIFDQGGLYLGPTNKWTYIPDQSADIPGASYSTRISANLDWIYSVIGTPITVPEPAGLALLLLGTAAMFRRQRP